MQPVPLPIGAVAADDDLYYSHHCLHGLFASTCTYLVKQN